MDATHARPMTAYAALCAAAVVVLAQGLSTNAPVADAIAQTGRPALAYADRVTLAAKQMTDRVGDLSTAVVGAAVAPALSPLATGQERATRTPAQQEATRAAITSTSPAADTAQVAKRVMIGPATQDLRAAGSSKVHKRVSVDRKADRSTAKDVRKAERATAKDARKAHRAVRRH